MQVGELEAPLNLDERDSVAVTITEPLCMTDGRLVVIIDDGNMIAAEGDVQGHRGTLLR